MQQVALRGFWADPAQRDAVMTPTVLQSASHLLCNQLGLQRHEEFAATWMVKTERRIINARRRTQAQADSPSLTRGTGKAVR